ncbi:LysM peptidoglycan-binding domain-containing protein [Thiobacillus sp.]|uniref:lytic transglycosylase n=1 Tax=Thiobacillus sp. TaxID=924 RepID=UPI00286DD898|nr:LysM peptidoglycan-binding domain-containing protein [Thiobacillus sp.]
MPGIKASHHTLSRLGLAILAACFSLKVSAADPSPMMQSLEWGNEASNTPDTLAAASEDDHEDVWLRIRGGFKIDDAASDNPLVAVHESWYAARPDYVRRMVSRSRSYLYHIVEEVDRRAMPMEVALLPMIESAFKSTALSTSSASGIWQFIPSTGRHYGLKQDTWYDGRRDFPAATNAALDYLSKLYLDFGDWQLALAAYNCGEGCVARAIQKNVQQGLPTDYASLTLPPETRNYVPKLLAIKHIIRNPEQYGLVIDTLPNQPYFNQIPVHANLDMHSAARLANMNTDDFMALNAAFPRKLIRSDTPVTLLVPVDKADQFQRNLEAGDWDSWQPYAAKKGERPQDIAKRFDVSLDRLTELNQFHLKRGKLVSAQTILVPVKGRGAVAPFETAAEEEATSPNPAHHLVQRGETLYGVARRYSLSTAQLIEANPGLDSRLQAGQRIQLPATATAARETRQDKHASLSQHAKKPAKSTRYTVKRGDTLHAIAERFDVSLSEIKAWNPDLKNGNKVRAGQTVVVNKT